MTIEEIFRCCNNLHIQSDIIVYQYDNMRKRKIFEGELHMFHANYPNLAKNHEVLSFTITDIELKKAEFLLL